MSIEVIPERDFRGPGCGVECIVVKAIVPGRLGRSELLVHDPASHEEFGRVMAGPMVRPLVWTGSLVIDRVARVAQLDGRVLKLTPREWELLEYLSGKPGQLCSVGEIAAALWDGDWGAAHVTRVVISRLRDKLGPVAELVETHVGRGYRLVVAPPVERGTAPVQLPPRRRSGIWAKAFDWCVCCGSTRRQHKAFGRCTGCSFRPGRRRQHVGPCQAPPAVMEVWG